MKDRILHIVQTPEGQLIDETISFRKESCKKKFTHYMLMWLSKPHVYAYDAVWRAHLNEGFKILEIDITNLIDNED